MYWFLSLCLYELKEIICHQNDDVFSFVCSDERGKEKLCVCVWGGGGGGLNPGYL